MRATEKLIKPSYHNYHKYNYPVLYRHATLVKTRGMDGDIMPKMKDTNNYMYTRYLFIMLNIKVTGMHSNTYTSIIYIGKCVKITVYKS